MGSDAEMAERSTDAFAGMAEDAYSKGRVDDYYFWMKRFVQAHQEKFVFAIIAAATVASVAAVEL